MKISGTYLKASERGFTLWELAIILSIVAVVILCLRPVVGFVRDEKDRIVCANNIRELGRVLYIFAKDHNGTFPDSLKVLYEEEYIADRKVLDCPATAHKGDPEEPDYMYTAGLSVRDISTATLLRDKEGNHKKGANIMTVNGTVLWQES